MTGVSTGFIPVGQNLGQSLASSGFSWVLIPIGAVIGYFTVGAEPAVFVLKKQIEEVSGGAIPGKAVQRYLSIGMAFSLSISMIRVLTGISIYWIVIPGYIAAMLLTLFTPKIFVGIAFDSGGVVSGPMTSTFLLPLAIGACLDPARIMTDAFGLVATIALAPLLVLQVMGIIYKSKMDKISENEGIEGIDGIETGPDADDEIIEFDDIPEILETGEQREFEEDTEVERV
jgi:uncharacterized membrane protein